MFVELRDPHLLIACHTKHDVDFWKQAGISPEAVKKGVLSSCAAVLEAEPELTRCDLVVGDGDCGATFAAGAKGAIIRLIAILPLMIEKSHHQGI